MNLVFSLAACANSLVDSFDRTAYGEADTFNHLNGNNYPEFGNGLLDICFFKLNLGRDCLELCLWTVTFKTS